MSEQKTEEQLIKEKAEKDSIKAKLDLMGVTYSPNAGIPRLREQLQEAMGFEEEPDVPEDMDVALQGVGDFPPGSHGELLNHDQWLSREANKLHRVIISCQNPNKKEWSGDYFDVGNSDSQSQRKYVPFDTEYHVPKLILDNIRERQCQIFVKAFDNKGREIKRGKLITEYHIVDLPPLTAKELQDLAHRQALRKGAEAAA